MSNPSQDKGPILQGQKAIEGRLNPSEQADQDEALGRMHDSVYQSRTADGKPLLTIHAADNVILNADGRKTETTPDMILRDRQIRQNAGDKNDKGQKQPYPQAQPSYDASGNLNHIDIMPDKDHYDKIRR